MELWCFFTAEIPFCFSTQQAYIQNEHQTDSPFLSFLLPFQRLTNLTIRTRLRVRFVLTFFLSYQHIRGLEVRRGVPPEVCVLRPLNALWRIFVFQPPAPGFSDTLGPHRAQMCSPDARGRALPGGVKDNLKTNGGASINTWSGDGQEAFPGLASRNSMGSLTVTTHRLTAIVHVFNEWSAKGKQITLILLTFGRNCNFTISSLQILTDLEISH